MLDKINGANSEAISQGVSLDRINEINSNNPYIENDTGYFVDESQISDAAFQKYQRYSDVQKFSKILMETDEQEAIDMVLKKAFDGTISIDDDIIGEIVSSSDFLNDII